MPSDSTPEHQIDSAPVLTNQIALLILPGIFNAIVHRRWILAATSVKTSGNLLVCGRQTVLVKVADIGLKNGLLPLPGLNAVKPDIAPSRPGKTLAFVGGQNG